jgi:predicted acyltransferase
MREASATFAEASITRSMAADISLQDTSQARDLFATTHHGPVKPAAAERLASIDAYRGLVMVLMISAGLGIGGVVTLFDRTPGWEHLATPTWRAAAYQTDHTEWVGCTLWDLIQPSFMFIVGVALPFSVAARLGRGQKFSGMLRHAIVRSIVLILLAVFLASAWSPHTNWSFTNVLGQIGLGYPFLFLLAWVRPRWQITAAMVILLAYWSAFALYPAPPRDLDLATVHLPGDWDRLQGFAAHWEKNTNLAARADQWFLNLFPRADGKPFRYEAGGYQTLNFVPSLATMIFGLLAGELLRGRMSGIKKVGVLLLSGAAAMAAGWALGRLGICPIVKRIWTPSWAIYSAGWAFVTLALFYLVLDVWRVRRWEYPLVVVGANSIAIYFVAQLMKPWVHDTLRRHFGSAVYELPGRGYAWLRYAAFDHAAHPPDAIVAYGRLFAPMADAAVFLLFCWLLCWWAYRRKLLIRI